MSQNPYHKPNHVSIRWALILLASVFLWLTTWGTAQARTVSLVLSPESISENGGVSTVTVSAVAGYGLLALEGQGLLTPYSVVTLEREGHRLRLGGMLGIRSSFNGSLEGKREVRHETATVYGVRLQANRRF